MRDLYEDKRIVIASQAEVLHALGIRAPRDGKVSMSITAQGDTAKTAELVIVVVYKKEGTADVPDRAGDR